jgi:hypothetical protein
VVELRALRPAPAHEHVAQPALADAGLADDPDDLRPAGKRLLPGGLQDVHFVVAPDELREPALA